LNAVSFLNVRANRISVAVHKRIRINDARLERPKDKAFIETFAQEPAERRARGLYVGFFRTRFTSSWSKSTRSSYIPVNCCHTVRHTDRREYYVALRSC